jgi:hypothetical protein
MRRELRSLIAVAAMLVCVVPGFPQYNRRDIANIARDVSNLAQNTWNMVQGDLDRRDPVGMRGPDGMELYLAINGFANSARAYSDVAARYQNDSILGGGARYLVNQAKLIDGLVDRTGALDQLRSDWARVQEAVSRLSEGYNLGYSPPRYVPRSGTGRNQERWATGRTQGGVFRWRGLVDGADYINIQGSRVTIDHLEDNPIRDADFSLPQALPRSSVRLQFNKIRGRGTVRLIEQPSQYNDYTAIVLIEDPDAGAAEYEFELRW